MSEPGGCHSSGISLGDVLRLPKRHPAWRRREAQSGSRKKLPCRRDPVSSAAGWQCRWATCTERENLAGDAKGKSASGSNREAESTDAPERGGRPRSSDEAGQCPWSKGGRSSPLSLGQLGHTGRSPKSQRKAAAFVRWQEPDDARVSSPESV